MTSATSRGMISTSSGSSAITFRASISSRIFIEPISAVIDDPVRPAIMIEVIKHAKFAQTQDANQIDGVGGGAEAGELEDALLGDDRADQEVDQHDDRHAAQPVHLEVMHHRGPAPAPRLRGEAQEHHDDFAEIVDNVEEIDARVVDRLADRREQRDSMRRRNARGLLGRMVASLLDAGGRAWAARRDRRHVAPAAASSTSARSMNHAPAVSMR